ncbi:MAG: helix-turn-helix domain-containing protein [Rikenellaceae bacterium]
MNIHIKTDHSIVEQIGKKIKELRLEQNITQAELRKRSGVSVRRIIDVEKGYNCTLLVLVQLLRALDAFYLIELFFAEKEISPIEYAKLMDSKKERQRARRRKLDNIDESEEEFELW